MPYKRAASEAESAGLGEVLDLRGTGRGQSDGAQSQVFACGICISFACDMRSQPSWLSLTFQYVEYFVISLCSDQLSYRGR